MKIYTGVFEDLVDWGADTCGSSGGGGEVDVGTDSIFEFAAR